MKTKFENGIMTVCLPERIDTQNSGMIGDEILGYIEKETPEKVTFDCTELKYIASAGLRVILSVGKR